MKREFIFVGVLSIFVMIAMMGFVLAQNETNVTTPSNETNVTAPSNETEDEDENETDDDDKIMNKSRCEAVNNRVSGRLRQFEEGRDKHLISLDNLRDRISNQADKLEEKGFNVSDIRDDLVILDEKIAKTKADYALFITKLANTRNFTCGKSEGQFKASLNEAKAQLKIIREDLDDIKKFFKDEIRDDFKELKKAAKDEAKERRENRTEERKERRNESREGRNSGRNGGSDDDNENETEDESDDDDEDEDEDEDEDDDDDEDRNESNSGSESNNSGSGSS